MTDPVPGLARRLREPLSDRARAETLVAEALAELARRGLAPPFEPPAVPTTCCGRGCNGCVWEGWFAAVNYWREEAARLLPGDQGAGAG
jgi:Oxidoreductase-like protein, N-terminal